MASSRIEQKLSRGSEARKSCAKNEEDKTTNGNNKKPGD
jgi:hypothetical protein